MPKVISQVRLMTYDLTKAPEGMVNQWVESNKLNAERVNAKRKRTIPNETAYVKRVAGVSSLRYRQCFNPNYISRKGLSARDIINRQAANIKSSYKKYQAGLEAMFKTVDGVPAKEFNERIDAGRPHFDIGVAKKVLSVSGSNELGPGLLTIAPDWLTDDPVTEELLRGGDEIVNGGPFCICKRIMVPSFKASLTGRLQQANATIVDGNYSAEVIKDHNDITNKLVQGFVDPDLGLSLFATDGVSYVNYIFDSQKGFYLEIKVSKK